MTGLFTHTLTLFNKRLFQITPPASERGLLRRSAIVLLLVLCGSIHIAFAQTTTVSSVPVNNAPTSDTPGSVNVTLQGDGTEAHPLEIGSVNEWNAFATYVNNNVSHRTAYAIITADITFTNNHLQPNQYKGTLDGQGHTITLHLIDSKECGTFPALSEEKCWGGLFLHTYSATIKNLRLAGEIRNNVQHCGTFVQNANSYTTIENCQSSVEIIKTASQFANGGMIGSCDELGSTITIKNCLVDGKFSVDGNYSPDRNGGFMGRLVGGTTSNNTRSLTVNNSYAHPQVIDSKYTNFCPFVYTSDSPTLSISNSYYKFPDGFNNLVTTGTNQGTNRAATGNTTTIVSNLNTNATKVTINNKQVDPWIAHNDTVYLRTFAKYVDIKDFSYGQTPNPSVEGNSGNGIVTYYYKLKPDGEYTTTKPTAVGKYTVKAVVAKTDAWNGWESEMDFEINALPYYDDTDPNKVILHNLPLRELGTSVTLKGKGTSAKQFEIGTPDEWDAFATLVNLSYRNNDGVYAKITADITFTGNHQQPGENDNFSFPHTKLGAMIKFYGTIDGQGHTITLNQQETGGDGGNKATWGGLIWHTKNATINNLKVVGVIRTSNINCGAFIQNPNEGSVTLNNCQSSVKIISSSATSYHGGFLGNQHQNVTTIIRNCLFDGKYDPCSNAGNDTRCSGFIGNRQATTNIYNSYSNPISIDNTYKYYHTFTQETTSGQLNLDGHSYYLLPSFSGTKIEQGVDASEMTPDAIVEGLNTGATLVNSQNPWIVHNDTVYLKTFAKYVDIQGWTYGSSPNAPTIEGNIGNGTVTYKYKVQGAADGTYATYTPGTTVLGAGSYTLKACVAKANGWNAWESTMDFTVSKATLTVEEATATATAEYGTQVKNIPVTATAKLGTTEVAGSWAFDNSITTCPIVGNTTAYTATFTPSTGPGNYNTLTTDITPTITPKDLTVTANDHTITYGDLPDNAGVSYTGFVNSETSTVLGGSLSYAYSYSQYGDVGNTYTITPSGQTSTNYNITFVPGTLTVEQKEVGLSWNVPATDPVYDGQTHCITADATGMVNGDEIGVTVTGEQTNAGNHIATASGLSGTKSGNYKLPDAKTQAFTISTRPVTVTPDEGQSKTYGDADPTLEYSVVNLVAGESLSGSLNRADGSDVGNYAITQGGVTDANNSNYTISFTTGKTFAITPKTVGITWGPTILTYNSTPQAPTATATELVGGDACNVTVTGQQTAVGVYSGANVATANELSNANYQLPDPKPTTAFEIANPLSMSFAANQLWGTWYGAYNYVVPAGMTAYKVSAVSGTTVTVDAIGYVPANTGVLINRTSTDAADVNSNIYNGVTSDITSLLRSGSPTAYTDYILNNDQFVLSSVSTIGEHRCYLPGSGTAGTRGLTIVVGDNTTDIEQKVIDIIETGEWYDMQGRRIERPHKKGLYIRDGKKVVIK